MYFRPVSWERWNLVMMLVKEEEEGEVEVEVLG